MSFYEKHLLPKLIHCVCGLKPMMRQREKILPNAKGVTLEIGIGSGLNLPYYNKAQVQKIIGIDPTPNKKALDLASSKNEIPFEFIQKSAEEIDFPNNTFDTIVSTYTFCTIPDFEKTIQECRRLLKPNGQLLYVEHGLAPDPKVVRTQNRINPMWKRLAGGCHLNRDIPKALANHGFKLQQLESMYLPGWKPATWNVWGNAIIN